MENKQQPFLDIIASLTVEHDQNAILACVTACGLRNRYVLRKLLKLLGHKSCKVVLNTGLKFLYANDLPSLYFLLSTSN